VLETVLKTINLSKRYGQYKALDNLCMQVPKGAIYGLVGKNGAGKTTLIRVLCGLQSPSSGAYSIYGVEYGQAGLRAVRRRMGAVVETPSLYHDLTARQNLEMQYRILGLPDSADIPELLELVGLSHTGKKKAGQFSLGMKQRLGIAVALCGGPDLLVLDEPINGLDPQGIVEMRELILALNRQKQITVLLSSHILDELSRLATHYGFIDSGRMVKEISAEALEEICRKCLRVEVSSTKSFSRAVDRMGLSYRIVSQRTADIYGEVNITALVEELNRESCQLLSVKEQEENLESYYINLVGGGHHD
jgi:ABC-2 type transport system ATP-binding protein